jgi:hypothetical protein
MIYETLLAIAWFLIYIYWYKMSLIQFFPLTLEGWGYTNEAHLRGLIKIILQRIGISRFNTAYFQNIAHGGAVIW